MNNTGIYIRVSTEDQAKDGFSINAQKEKLTKYAEANDWKIFDYYIDDGISGKNLDGRPEVTRLLNDIKNRKIDNILIYKLDRLTRSVKDLIYLIELFEKYNCTFNSQTEKIDTSNAVGRMFVKIIGIFAEFERENLAERVSFGYEQKTREGNYTNCNGVYGYDYIVKEHRLVVNEEEKELVNRIFDLYINGESYFKIAFKLNEENVITKRGGHWASSTIKSIINNPLYIGKVRYGLEKKNKDKFFVTDGNNIEPIVSNDKWNLAKNIISKRKSYSVRRYPSENSYYFHTIKCAICGGNISARQQKQNGKIYITYKCNNAIKGLCKCKGFSHINMEKIFLDYLNGLENMKFNSDIIKKKENNNDLENIERKIKKLENKKNNIKTKFINDLINIDEYHGLNKEINYQEKLLYKKMNELENSKEKKYDYEDIKELIINVKLNWEYLTNKEKRHFLERFVDKILICKNEKDLKIEEIKFKIMESNMVTTDKFLKVYG